ncbi:hypothetical protein PR202_ga04120 [Eleusine coracana subsp. coracana]|uniref:Uncharacterized protein n=1 Tax=Eleusine coracana subsp. coracana TaxID=191504 RepID=A0AAV5BNV3_ELECO|nr:hypothetical protein PR202_ga04120 [Eleusine coracana subsp. coracana]
MARRGGRDAAGDASCRCLATPRELHLPAPLHGGNRHVQARVRRGWSARLRPVRGASRRRLLRRGAVLGEGGAARDGPRREAPQVLRAGDQHGVRQVRRDAQHRRGRRRSVQAHLGFRVRPSAGYEHGRRQGHGPCERAEHRQRHPTSRARCRCLMIVCMSVLLATPPHRFHFVVSTLSPASYFTSKCTLLCVFKQGI